jgi:hypothetical protein
MTGIHSLRLAVVLVVVDRQRQQDVQGDVGDGEVREFQPVTEVQGT